LTKAETPIHPAPIAEAEQRQRKFDRLGDRGALLYVIGIYATLAFAAPARIRYYGYGAGASVV
jgi:hypothetical protein